ncbi:hypothetical protein GCM10028801_41340 [Nocardioides maradonensis]
MARHLSFPLQVSSRGLATVEHNSEQDIAQSVSLLLSTRPGERRSVPDFGLPDPVFGGVSPSEIDAVVTEWEPRADLQELDIALLTGDALALLTDYRDGTFGASLRLGVVYGDLYDFDTPLAESIGDGTYRIGD